jgi:xanthine dehydrogenase accessory factor
VSDLEIYRNIIEILDLHGQAALVTIIAADHSTPRGVGTKMLVRPDNSIIGTIGGGAVEAEAIRMAIEVIKTGKTQKRQFNLIPGESPGMICGGEMEVFVERIAPVPTVYIFGAGHISSILAKISKLLRFTVVVIDDRKDYANKERFPDADRILVDDFDQAFSKLTIDKQSYIVIVTRGHHYDELVLRKAIHTPAGYVGMIGSKSKVKTVFNNLRASGVENKLIERVHSPIGLDINAETPEEIAVSIIAEIIKIYRSPV